MTLKPFDAYSFIFYINSGEPFDYNEIYSAEPLAKT